MSIPALGDCMLDIAGLHANEIAWGIDQLQRGGLTWVVAGMKFQIYRMPKIDSRFKIETHVSGYSRISTQRDFLAFDDNGKIAEVSSEWLIINMENRRPVFISDYVPQLEEVCIKEGALPKFKHLRQGKADVTERYQRRILYSDIDINRHLYSMRYLQMALDTFDLNYLSGNDVKTVDVNFISEVLCGETVDVVRRSEGDVHLVEMMRDGSAVFRAEVAMN
jgi:acyl-ACP thioesterase